MTPPAGDDAPIRLRDLSEEEILARILPLLGATDPVPELRVGPGDDAAVVAVENPLVVTTDSMIRSRDWRDDWSTPGDVARKLGAQNIADVAAMGGVATGAVLTVTADPQVSAQWVERFAAGLGQWCREAGVAIVGGDLSSAPADVVHLSLTMWGSLEGREPVLRSGARPGEVVAVCGSLGWSSAGLASYLAEPPTPRRSRVQDTPSTGTSARRVSHSRLEQWRRYHRSPRPPWEAGPVAARAGATSMIDVSDGLVRDLGRVARESGVRVNLERDALEREFVAAFTEAMPAEEAWEHVLGGGEEHSLVATFPDEGRVPHTPDTPWRVIGRVRDGAGVTLDGEPVVPSGWDHFRP